MKSLRSLKFPVWSIPLALFAVCALAYGLLINRLGFYWDDWEPILVIKQFSLSEFLRYFAGNRPLAGWTYFIFTPLAGVNPLSWQIISFALRYLSVLGMWLALLQIWPTRKVELGLVAALFAVYPVFMQQPIAVSYHQHWTGFALYFLSVTAMLYLARSNSSLKIAIPLTILGMVAVLLHLLVLEYFIGVEMLRPVFLWLVLSDQGIKGRERWKKVIIQWLPYLLVLIGFLAWRLAYAVSAATDANRPVLLLGLLTQPVQSILRLVENAVHDSLYILASSWTMAFTPASFQIGQAFSLFSWALVIVSAAGLAFFFLRVLRTDTPVEKSVSERGWVKQLFWVGLLATLFGSLPIWVTDRVASDAGLFSDRFALVSMFGASLLVLALLEWLSDRWMEKVVLLCALIGLGIGVQLRNENDFRWSWVNQTRISWQLFWRAPSITPNTLFTSDQDIMTYNRPTFAFNLLYLQPRGTHQLPYWYSLLGRDQAVDIPSLLAGSDVQATHRDFTFNAKSHDSLMLYYDSKFANCLWVLGPQDQNDPYLPAITLQALPLSNLNRIQAQPFSGNYPDTNIFGKEPSHGWCYYYEKTDLARQLGDWEQVSELGDQARAKGFSPNASESNSPHEWEPIIEGYARSGRWADAAQITLTSFQKDPNYQAALCNLWNRVKDQPGAETDYQRMVNQLGCK